MGEPSVDSLLGATLSHFQVDARLGAGGMGVVYRAHDTRLARAVALKVLPPQLSQDPERKQLLMKEARAAAAINHPNLAAIYEVGEESRARPAGRGRRAVHRLCAALAHR